MQPITDLVFLLFSRFLFTCCCAPYRPGKLIIDDLLRLADHHGCYKVTLNCSEANAPFYEKCGFSRKDLQMTVYNDHHDVPPLPSDTRKPRPPSPKRAEAGTPLPSNAESQPFKREHEQQLQQPEQGQGQLLGALNSPERLRDIDYYRQRRCPLTGVIFRRPDLIESAVAEAEGGSNSSNKNTVGGSDVRIALRSWL